MPEGFVYILKKVEDPKQDVGHYYIRSSKFGLEDYSQKVQDEYRNTPREIMGYIKSPKYQELRETLIQLITKVFSIEQSEEGFIFKHEQIVELFSLFVSFMDNSEFVEIQAKETNQVIEQKPKRTTTRERFCFSMIDLKVGAKIKFKYNNIVVTVASDNTVSYQGKELKLSPMVEYLIPEQYKIKSGAYQGSKYFYYKDKTLDDWRKFLYDPKQTKRRGRKPKTAK